MEDYRSKLQHILDNAVVLTDAAVRMKERVASNETHFAQMRALIDQGQRVAAGADATAQVYLARAELLVKATSAALRMVPGTEKKLKECESFLAVIRKETSRYGQENIASYHTNLAERINQLKEQQRDLTRRKKSSSRRRHLSCPSTKPSSGSSSPMFTEATSSSSWSAVSTRQHDREHYPDAFSRDSLIAWSCLADLPSVPEELLDCLAPRVVGSAVGGGRRGKLMAGVAGRSSSARFPVRLWTNSVIREEDEGTD